MSKDKIYLISEYIKSIILVFGKDVEIFSSFDKNGHFLSYSEDYISSNNKKIYSSNIESLYIILRIEIYQEIDFFLLIMLEKRNLNNISILEMARLLDVSKEMYINIEEGIKVLNENQRKVVCEKFGIKSFTKKEFFDTHFKLIK